MAGWLSIVFLTGTPVSSSASSGLFGFATSLAGTSTVSSVTTTAGLTLGAGEEPESSPTLVVKCIAFIVYG